MSAPRLRTIVDMRQELIDASTLAATRAGLSKEDARIIARQLAASFDPSRAEMVRIIERWRSAHPSNDALLATVGAHAIGYVFGALMRELGPEDQRIALAERDRAYEFSALTGTTCDA